MTRTTASGIGVHLSTVLAGLHWLYDTTQPPGAVVCLEDRGQSLTTPGGWRLTFMPAGPSGAPTILVDSAAGRDVLSLGELDEFACSVEDFGETVARTGFFGDVGFLVLERPAHPSLRRAIDRGASDRSGSGGRGVGVCGRGIGVEDVRRRMLRQFAALRPLAELWSASLAAGVAGAGRPASRSRARRSLRLRCGGLRC